MTVKNHFMATIGLGLFLASVLPVLLPAQTPASADISADPRVRWLLKEAVKVRTVDPADEDFRDLQPLKKVIGDALASVAFCDDIVLVDSGSRDRTRAIAQAAGARVLINAPWPGFVAQRDFATTGPQRPGPAEWRPSVPDPSGSTPTLSTYRRSRSQRPGRRSPSAGGGT